MLHLLEVEDPEIQDDEVLIKVAAAALNRADTFRRKGLHTPPPAGSSPYLGIECSGTILAVGKKVSRWKIGDQVVFGHFFVLAVWRSVGFLIRQEMK